MISLRAVAFVRPRTPGIPTPRWVSYYLDVPVWPVNEHFADRVRPGDLVLARTDLRHDWIELPEESILESGHYRLVDGSLMNETSDP
ncbi:MAG: hypothetical protein F4Z17_02095 [Acidimicrobiia bacterium]|nr:hypothetical protein [Acidimicrobiia bacterium]